MATLPSRQDYPSYQAWKSAYDSALVANKTTPEAVATGQFSQTLSPAQQRAKDIASGQLSYNGQTGQREPRPGATVATSQNPVISKTTTNELAYDETNPEDYLMKLSAKTTTTGKTPTQTELYNMYKAQKALTDKNTTNPMQAQIDALLKQYNEGRASEQTNDAAALEAYKKQLDISYAEKIKNTENQGVKQKESAQGVYSFSGFGRSTAAADKMVEIQQSTDSAINALNAAKEMEIELKRAELAGADPDSLKGLYESLSSSRKAANDWQIESMKKTADANAASGASYVQAIQNFMTTAAKNGIDIGDPKVVLQYAQMAKNPDGTINESFIKTLPEGVQSMIRSAAGGAMANNVQTKDFGTAKSPRWMQSFDNGKTWVAMSGAAGGSGGGGGGGTAKGTALSNNLIGMLDDLIADPNLSAAVGPGFNKILNQQLFGDQYMGKSASYKAKRDTFVNQQVLPNLKLLKGTMSDKDVAFIQSASVPANLNMDEKSFKAQLANMRAVLAGQAYVNDNGVLVKGVRPGYMGATNTSTAYDANKQYKAGDTFSKDGKTYKVDANLDYIEQ